MKKPNIMTQLSAQSGLGRPGGMMSKASTPVPASTGRGFAAMENAMSKQLAPNPTKMTKGMKTRQFKKGAGENTGQT